MSKIKHYRLMADMTQAELAAEVGLESSAAISNYETGARNADVRTLMRIRDAFRAKKVKVAIEDLIDDQPESKPAA